MRKLKNLFGSDSKSNASPAAVPQAVPIREPPRRAIGISGIERNIVQTDRRNQQVIQEVGEAFSLDLFSRSRT